MLTKICGLCGEEKYLNEFGKNRSRKDGLTHYCSPCHRGAVAAARFRKLRGLPPPGARRGVKPFMGRGEEKDRRRYHAFILRRHGLTPLKYGEMLIAQAGRCAGCLEELRRPCVDHDHSTGRIRGLLCHQCNTVLGHSYDSPATLHRLADYLSAF